MAMPKYLFAYHGGAMAQTEEEQQKVMAAWGAWFEQLGPAIVDPGAPIAMARTVSTGGAADGAGANPLTGYSLIEAADLDDASTKAAGCPVLTSGGTVEVAETIPM
jgi:hypothetical protein